VSTGTMYGGCGRGLPRIKASKCLLDTEEISSQKALYAAFMWGGRELDSPLLCSSNHVAAWLNSCLASFALVRAADSSSIRASCKVEGGVVDAAASACAVSLEGMSAKVIDLRMLCAIIIIEQSAMSSIELNCSNINKYVYWPPHGIC